MSVNAPYWARIAASLTEEERDWLLKTRRRRLAGGRKLTNAEIGAKIGKPHYWVSGVCLALKSGKRVDNSRKPVHFSERDVAEFTKMWTDGVKCAEIGRYWGRAKDWASVRAASLGLPKRNNVVITNQQVREIKRRFEAGEPGHRIAEAMGVSRGTVKRYTAGIKAPPREPKGPPRKIDRGLADRMARNGMRHADIAAHFNVTRSAVEKAISRYRKRLEALSARKPAAIIPVRSADFREAA